MNTGKVDRAGSRNTGRVDREISGIIPVHLMFIHTGWRGRYLGISQSALYQSTIY